MGKEGLTNCDTKPQLKPRGSLPDLYSLTAMKSEEGEAKESHAHVFLLFAKVTPGSRLLPLLRCTRQDAEPWVQKAPAAPPLLTCMPEKGSGAGLSSLPLLSGRLGLPPSAARLELRSDTSTLAPHPSPQGCEGHCVPQTRAQTFTPLPTAPIPPQPHSKICLFGCVFSHSR